MNYRFFENLTLYRPLADRGGLVGDSFGLLEAAPSEVARKLQV
jgi:hypothetical protein